jgi:hypothetical protein
MNLLLSHQLANWTRGKGRGTGRRLVEGRCPWVRASAKMSVREWESLSGQQWNQWHQWEKDSVPSSVSERKDSVPSSVSAGNSKRGKMSSKRMWGRNSVQPSERVWAQDQQWRGSAAPTAHTAGPSPPSTSIDFQSSCNSLE